MSSHVLPAAAQRRDRLCLLPARLQDAEPFAVVDPHVDLVEQYVALAEAQGVPIVAVFETHVQADHVSGLPELVARTGATAYLPAGAGVEFDARRARTTASASDLGNTTVQALATPGHAPPITPTWSPTTRAPTSRGWC